MVFILSFALTGLIRQHALAKNIVDVPNHRSSHSLPTPRGGGLAFVILFLLSLPILASISDVSFRIIIPILCSGLLVGGLGYIDDHYTIAARWRLLGHSVVGVIILYWLGGLPTIPVFGFNLSPGLFSDVLAFFYLVWLVNLYNFMDGINGIASVEAISICVFIACIYWITGAFDLVQMPIILAASVMGFIFWNFPKPRIFMGDAGSGFLGIILGILSIQAAQVHAAYFYCWLILLGIFIVDATITLLRRLSRGDKIHQAHRSHAYQYAARRLKSHTTVTCCVLALNSFWLFPLALLVALGYLQGIVGLIIAYLPLVFLAIYFRAGQMEIESN